MEKGFKRESLLAAAKRIKNENGDKIGLAKLKKADLYKYIQKNCNNSKTSMCIADLKNSVLSKFNLLSNSLPQYHEDWLTNYDIDGIMSVRTRRYKDFAFLGSFPYDYPPHLDDFDIRSINEKKRIACIFNTATMASGGEHWVAVFIDLGTPSICYFDSYNHDVDKYRSINRFIKRMENQLNVKSSSNGKSLQKTGGECGVYCIYFILSRLTGKKCGQFQYNDMEMKKVRKKLMKH